MMMSQSSHSCVFSPFSFVCVLKSLSATNDTSGWIKWCWSCSFHFSKASSTAQTTPWVAKKWPNPSSCMILPLADQSRLRWKWRNMSFRASKWSIKKKQNKKTCFNIIIPSASNHSAVDVEVYLLHGLPRYALSSASDGALCANHEREKAPAHQRRPLQGSCVTCTTSENTWRWDVLQILNSAHTICATTSMSFAYAQS